MGEKIEQIGIFSNPIVRRAAGALSIAAVMAGGVYAAIKYGPHALSELTTEQSAVVAGAPGLVMQGYAETYKGGVTYELLVEQCPQDVKAAEHGNQNSKSYNTNPNVMTPGCYADWVLVDRDTYYDQLDGSYIFFDGQPTEHLRKPRTFGG